MSSPAFIDSLLWGPVPAQQQPLSPLLWQFLSVLGQVGSNAGIVGMTKEHLGLALALNVPVFVVVTKIDMCPANILQGKWGLQSAASMGLSALHLYGGLLPGH